MKKLDRVGRSLADHQGAYVLKARLITESSDVRVSLRDFDVTDLHLNSRITFRNEEAELKARTEGSSLWLRLSPHGPYSWFSFVIDRTDTDPNPGIRLKKSVALRSNRVTGIFDYRWGQLLPHLTTRLQWNTAPFSLAGALTLAGSQTYTVRDFEAAVSYRTPFWKSQIALTRSPAGVRAGIGLQGPKMALAWTLEQPEASLSGSFVAKTWDISFQAFAKRWAAPKLAVRRKTEFGNITTAVDFGGRRVMARIKRITAKDEIAVIVTGKGFGLEGWRLSLSVTQVAEVRKKGFAFPNPHVPFRN
jgi:hypothetical protein